MIQLSKLTKRQSFILHLVNTTGGAANKEILEKVLASFDKASRITIIRDLNALLKSKLLKKTGSGRGVVYVANLPVPNRVFDMDAYFEIATDDREIRKEKLNFDDTSIFKNLFTAKEREIIALVTKEYRQHIASYDKAQTKRELERITVEFSWKSSHIEGNTYSLLDTERLIKNHEEANGKTHDEAVMILNHKKALEFIWAHAKDFRKISPRKIEDIHSMVSSDLGIEKGLRKRGVGIVGTAYKPFDNIFQIRESLESLCSLVNGIADPFAASLVAVAGISYIQPFEDGNKRTSRLVGNAILAANGLCPLSYRSANEADYKKAIILFYEQHSLEPFKKLFLEQYKSAVENYFI